LVLKDIIMWRMFDYSSSNVWVDVDPNQANTIISKRFDEYYFIDRDNSESYLIEIFDGEKYTV